MCVLTNIAHYNSARLLKDLLHFNSKRFFQDIKMAIKKKKYLVNLAIPP